MRMKLSMWQVDAFSNRRFAGNPAAIVPLEGWLADELLLAIAAENNLSETAYIVREGGEYQIRWFTPTEEVPLCGHATLASAWLVFHRLEPERKRVVFRSKSGELPVERKGERLVLDFPANTLEPATATDGAQLVAALGQTPRELYSGWQWLALYDSEEQLRALRPDMAGIVATGVHGVIVTAPGRDCDFVSRFFAPAAGVPEDPVTGSAHTRLVPFWAGKLGKTTFFARQVSSRGGELWCELSSDKKRVSIAGEAALFLEGIIDV
ncbi:MAG TPA: PhzF family phenazine biosynthesis protein [Polyangiaceae bacterium]|nr:PhzF family phenazine biosynthesis protein [Polyangiaceae bacterium]